MNGFSQDRRLRLYTNRKFEIFRSLPPKVTEVSGQDEIFLVLEHTSFPFVKSYFAVEITLEFDSLVVRGLDWVFFSWEAGEVYSIEGHDYVCPENLEGNSVVHEEVVDPVLPKSITYMDAEAAYRHYRGLPASVAPSRKYSAASPAPSRLNDVYVGNLDDEWEVNADDDGATRSGCWKELWSTSDRYRHLLIGKEEL